jgi:hypothetical protein
MQNVLVYAAARAQQTAAAVHGEANAVGHEPGGLVGDAKRTMNLMAADALLRRREQMRCEQPFGQADLGSLEHGAHGHGVLFTAGHALLQAGAVGFAIECIRAFRRAAMWAYRTIRPAEPFQVFAGFGVVVELRGVESVHDRISLKDMVRFQTGFVKYIFATVLREAGVPSQDWRALRGIVLIDMPLEERFPILPQCPVHKRTMQYAPTNVVSADGLIETSNYVCVLDECDFAATVDVTYKNWADA